MKLYKTTQGIFLQNEGKTHLFHDEWTGFINRNGLFEFLLTQLKTSEAVPNEVFEEACNIGLQPPIGDQEVWAAGVTYLKSRDARMEESKSSGGADFYEKVYHAERPELFFKSMPHRVAAHREEVYIRKDSAWNVPEPELTLFINSEADIQAYTIGNDMSSRDIEGENPLYLPQAKVYERSAALGPCLYVPGKPIPLDTKISIIIKRQEKEVFTDSIQLNRMKRKLTELAEYLFRECAFPNGCFLMTGTGMVPPADFTLQEKDIVEITIEGIGMLSNTVVVSGKKV